MAEVTETRVLPPEFIEAAGKVYLGDLASATGQFKTADLSKVFGPQFTAKQDPLQARAQQLATQGIGAYQPFLQTAQAAQQQAGRLAGQAETQAGLAGQFVGPQAYQQFMSPYQQDVIKATLDEFDVQAAKGIPNIAAQAVGAGVLGGGREGVMRSEYQTTSDRNRAALQAQLLQQGFGQAQQAAQTAFGQQQALANQQQQLAQQQLGLGSAATGLGSQQQAFLGQDVGALSTLGAQNQAQRQAELAAQQQLAQQQLNQPLTAAQQYGTGVTSLIAGYPGQTQTTTAPSPNPMMTAIGAGGTLAGIYRAFNQPGVLNT
tara:strand:- start:1491 stop:2444 length:954 start_codon:yes stop_codon:yes gene_type:complete